MKDVDGDGRIDVFCRLIEMPFSQVVWFDSSRKQVWMRSDFPQVRATRAACQSSTSTAMAGMRVSSSGTLPSPVGPMLRRTVFAVWRGAAVWCQMAANRSA